MRVLVSVGRLVLLDARLLEVEDDEPDAEEETRFGFSGDPKAPGG